MEPLIRRPHPTWGHIQRERSHATFAAPASGGGRLVLHRLKPRVEEIGGAFILVESCGADFDLGPCDDCEHDRSTPYA